MKCFRLAVDNLLFYSALGTSSWLPRVCLDLRRTGGHRRRQNLGVAFEYKYGLLVSEELKVLWFFF